MKTQRIEIKNKTADRRLEKWAEEARGHLGVALQDLEGVKVYKIVANDTLPDVFSDPVLQDIYHAATDYGFSEVPSYVVDVSFRPGVTDNPARAAEEALALAGCTATVASGDLYFLFGNVDAEGARKIALELLANDLIQKADVYAYADFMALDRFGDVHLPTVQIVTPAQAGVQKQGSMNSRNDVSEISLDLSDADLEDMSRTRLLALSLNEILHIKSYFKQQGRNPTDVELEILAQSWSEHCKHKIFAADIDYTGPGGEKKKISSLYKTYIKKATRDIEKQRGIDWLVSVFSDNAGIVRFDDKLDVCIKVETHNTPSALDPYGGALTGILGVNRDILGAGMGARPVANMDVFCFAPPDMPDKDEAQYMPQGVKPPRRILEGVHKGVEDGGNKSGIPTVNGAFFFDRDYAGKPLVFVGTVGVLPPVLPDGRKSAEKTPSTGDRVYMVGGAIGADGIHGATFSSIELDESSPATAVQIGDPLTQKRVTDFLMEARDLGLYSAITDNGAGGLSSSVGEMATMTNGAEIDLALCPVKYPGLKPWELMISESQERMTLAVPPQHKAAFEKLARQRGVVATDIGVFKDDGLLTVLYDGAQVAEMPLDFIHDSLPPLQLQAEWAGGRSRAAWSATSKINPRTQPVPEKVTDALLALLQTPNITSKEKWVRAYDHEVQAATHMKPFTGVENDGPSDAGVIWLKPHAGGDKTGVAIGCGMAPRLSPVDPYLMAQYAVDEAVRNVVAAGGDPDMLCLLDNFCWPDPVVSAKNPDGAYKMGQLVRTCEGLYDICTVYGAPLVSGKDSMKNDFRGKDKRGEKIDISILPTLLMTAMAKTTVGIAPGSAFKQAGDVIYLVGGAGAGLVGSEYAALFQKPSPSGRGLGEGAYCAPDIDMPANMTLYRNLHAAMRNGLLQSIHDVSEGGMLVALAESCIGGRLGAQINVDGDHAFFFNEAAGRFVVSVLPENAEVFEKVMGEVKLGTVADSSKLVVSGESVAVNELVQVWKMGF